MSDSDQQRLDVGTPTTSPDGLDGLVVLVIKDTPTHQQLVLETEGVESPGQRDRLAALGVDIGQGYLWGRAMPIEQALELVRAAELSSPGHRSP